jgi:hypothetical protein
MRREMSGAGDARDQRLRAEVQHPNPTDPEELFVEAPICQHVSD